MTRETKLQAIEKPLKFIDFLEGKVPVQVKYSRKLLTADHKSNVGKFKHNYMITICTVCKVSYLFIFFFIYLILL